jgi:rRNA biogenesis protein RRP5
VFQKWADWEESVGNKKGAERVRALEKAWVEKKGEEKDEE